MKQCLFCNKILSVQQRHNEFCSVECYQKNLLTKKIELWKSGGNVVTKSGQLSTTIRNFLLQKANFSCQKCGWNQINPVTHKTPLEIHHIDGNYLNNSQDNLQVLCPNCHSLTPNYKALNKNGRNERIENSRRKSNLCIECGTEIGENAVRCRACQSKRRITQKPVTREELKILIRSTPFTTIGDNYGVTDNAIRKWCKSFNLPTKKKDIQNYTDAEWEQI